MLSALLLAAATPVVADTQIEQDMRCVAVFTVVLGANTELTQTERMGVTGGVYYFLGRIDVRDPEFDLQSNMIRLLDDPAYEKQFPLDAERCGKELEAKGQFLIDMGKALQVHSAAVRKPKT